ncbi:MAG TPA: DUF2333 family protein [Gammaproteobacteria bacterium]|nr:DUF2333 family protein [Gammaproteobacteria bacterium]
MLTRIKALLPGREGARGMLDYALAAGGVAALAIVVMMILFDHEPAQFDVRETTALRAATPAGSAPVRGATTTATMIEIIDRLLHKRGGYLSNDVMPPGLLMDNMPNWEWGALVQTRDLAIALRNDLSRSQTQSTEDPNLVKADNKLRIDSESWMFPAAEREYQDAADALTLYLQHISAPGAQRAQFYARADNLRNWLAVVEKRLGDLSQRLSASVGQVRVNTDLAGDIGAEQSSQGPDVLVVQTPWLQIDDVFYEARGASWALLHFLRAVEQDFASVLDKRNALVSLRQVIRELESTQDLMWSPMVLNGEGFGFVANHSLVMASYISRANAAIIDLRMLLERG